MADELTAAAGDGKPVDLSRLTPLELILRGLRESKPARDTSHSPINFIPANGGEAAGGGGEHR